MPTLLSIRLIIACAVSAVLIGCTHSPQTNAQTDSSAQANVADFELTDNGHGIQLSGAFNAPDEWHLELATPLLQSPQPADNSYSGRYSIQINDTTERLPITVSEVAKGPLYFSVAVGHTHLPVHQLTLYSNGTPLQVIQNEHPLPAVEQWLSQLKLTTDSASQHSEQFCLTWPDQLFEQAALLTVNEQGRLHLQAESSSSPVCFNHNEESSTQLRVNLRNPMFAVQLKTTL